MATIVAVDCTDGVVLAGDRQVVEGGTVVGSQQHVFEFGDVGAAAVGGDPAAFSRQLEVALRGYSAERGEPGIDAAARMAAEVAGEVRVEVLVAARDETGSARTRSVLDGTLEGPIAALGSASELLVGRLDAIGEVDLDAAESAVREAFEVAAERDPGTGEELDLWRLEDAEGGETV